MPLVRFVFTSFLAYTDTEQTEIYMETLANKLGMQVTST